MPVEVTHPGVTTEEVPAGPTTITGVETSITAFVGRTLTGPTDPTDVFSFAEFAQRFGGRSSNFPLSYSVEDFFQNGGGHAIIVRVLPSGASGNNAIKSEDATATSPADPFGNLEVGDYVGDLAALSRTGIYALDRVDLFNLLCIPWDRRGEDLPREVYRKAADYCVKRRAMLILDPRKEWIEKANAGNVDQILPADFGIGGPDFPDRNCAVYFPRVKKADPEMGGSADVFPVCGIVAGVMATTDLQRGVWKAPAGIAAGLTGIDGLEINVTDNQNGVLNQLGINCLRNFPVIGPVVWGARTLRGADLLSDDYKYIPVRRLTLFIEESLYRGTKFAVFEPNDETLWSHLRLAVGAFMTDLARQGAFYQWQVACDRTTTTQDDIDRGIVNIRVAFAPVKPAEFILLQIQQMAGQTAA